MNMALLLQLQHIGKALFVIVNRLCNLADSLCTSGIIYFDSGLLEKFFGLGKPLFDGGYALIGATNNEVFYPKPRHQHVGLQSTDKVGVAGNFSVLAKGVLGAGERPD